ncbi:hypothetical protein THAOC_04858, partial [Thalassiosira oceanica]
ILNLTVTGMSDISTILELGAVNTKIHECVLHSWKCASCDETVYVEDGARLVERENSDGVIHCGSCGKKYCGQQRTGRGSRRRHDCSSARKCQGCDLVECRECLVSKLEVDCAMCCRLFLSGGYCASCQDCPISVTYAVSRHTVLAVTATETLCGIADGAKNTLATPKETEMEIALTSCLITTTGQFVRAAMRRSRMSSRASSRVIARSPRVMESVRAAAWAAITRPQSRGEIFVRRQPRINVINVEARPSMNEDRQPRPYERSS